MRTAILVLVAALALAACQQRATPNDPVFLAIKKQDPLSLDAFLKAGGDANLTNRDGESLLFVATGANGSLTMARRIIAAGADLEQATPEGRTPLMNALGWCDVDLVTLLIDSGADLSAYTGPKLEDAACKAPLDRRQAVMALVEDARN